MQAVNSCVSVLQIALMSWSYWKKQVRTCLINTAAEWRQDVNLLD